MIGVIWMIVNLHFNWLPENALNKAYQVWLPDININFLDIWIDTTTTNRKKESKEKERKHGNELGLVAKDEVAIRWCRFHKSSALLCNCNE